MQSHNERDGSSWALTTSAFGLLAAWPYAISYLIATHANTRTLVSTFVQTILLCLVTVLVCSTYTGHLFHLTLTVWNIVQITATQAFLFFAACGLGEMAAEQIEISGLPTSSARLRLVWGSFDLGTLGRGIMVVPPGGLVLALLARKRVRPCKLRAPRDLAIRSGRGDCLAERFFGMVENYRFMSEYWHSAPH